MILFSVALSHSHLMGSSTDGGETRKEQIYKLARAVISHGTRSKFVNRHSVLSSREIRCHCLRKHTCCHNLHLFIGYSKRIPL